MPIYVAGASLLFGSVILGVLGDFKWRKQVLIVMILAGFGIMLIGASTIPVQNNP